MRKILCVAVALLFAVILSAQNGKISGKVINVSSGQVLSSATVILVEKSRREIADQNGAFSFSKLPAGVYSIKCSYVGYVEKLIDSVIVREGESTVIDISMEEKRTQSDEVVIVSKKIARVESVASLLSVQKNSASVSDGITAESIKKTPDRSTSDVIKRVSGASIQDDRFAIIRGLNDRYNAAFINGAPLPSTESDRKAFAFDIFPSSILDNLIIYKTATPDMPGEFAGGAINITTKSIPSKNFTAVSVGAGYNDLITGKNRYFSANKGKQDWLGIDDGTRGIPSGIPAPAEVKNLPFTERAELAKLYGNYKWGIKQGNTIPNINFQLTQGLNIERKGKEFMGALFSVIYNKNYTFKSGERNGFDPFLSASPDDKPYQRGNYIDSLYNEETVVAALANISFKINNSHNIGWKNNWSVNTDNQLLKRTGAYDLDGDPTSFVKDDVRIYTSNRIFSSQLIGEHQVGKLKTKINWLGAYSSVNRKMPGTARTSYVGNTASPNDLIANFSSGTIVPFSGSGNMFATNSNENIKSFKVDITQAYRMLKNSQNFVKIGAGYQARSRDFTSRLLGLSPYMQAPGGFDYTLYTQPLDQVFLPENLGEKANGKGGFLLEDGTLPNSDYTASSVLKHAYIMSDQRFFKKIRLIYGLRLEQFNQKLNALDALNKPLSKDSTVNDFLPSVNIVYALTSKINIRISYAQTVNRPEFRELAPFLFYENVSGFTYEGNPKLQRAKIKNYDFRFEFYPGKAQLFSVSAFYKDFTNPIEVIQIPNTSAQTIFNNALSAKVYGVEAEFRTLIATLLGIKNEHSLFSKFTFSANAAYVKSKVVLGPLFSIAADQLVTDRALQGQSPYVVNGSMGFNDDKIGLSSTLSVNRVGDRILIAGTYNTADIYEKARTVVDFQVAKTFLKEKLEFKFNIRDLLAQKTDFYFDFDRNKSFSKSDRFFSSNFAPRVISFSAAYKF